MCIKTIEERLQQHWSEANRNTTYISLFHRALIKYGVSVFLSEVIETADSEEELNLAEIKWIKHYQDLSLCYNIAKGRMILCL